MTGKTRPLGHGSATMLSRSQSIGMSPGRWRLTQSYACSVYASTGASQYSQRAIDEYAFPGST